MSLQMNRDIHDEEDRDQNEEGEDAMDDPDDDLIDCIKKMSEKPDQQMRRIRCKQEGITFMSSWDRKICKNPKMTTRLHLAH